jgi:hypothetical protein
MILKPFQNLTKIYIFLITAKVLMVAIFSNYMDSNCQIELTFNGKILFIYMTFKTLLQIL